MAGLQRALPASWYLHRAAFEREWERLLFGEWFCAGRCPYHSWTYRLEGDLLRAPWGEEIDGFDEAAFGLHPVGVATWGGFVFLHLTPERAAPLDQLGPVPERLRRYPLESLAWAVAWSTRSRPTGS